MSEMNVRQRLLANFMSDLSEKYWSAGWLHELEYRLWAEVTIKAAFITQEEADVLRELSQMSGDGWVVWTSRDGETWVPMTTWEKLWAERYR